MLFKLQGWLSRIAEIIGVGVRSVIYSDLVVTIEVGAGDGFYTVRSIRRNNPFGRRIVSSVCNVRIEHAMWVAKSFLKKANLTVHI